MSIVIDANVVVTSAAASELGARVRERLQRWRSAGEDFHAPQLFTYEVASALCSLEANAGQSPRESDDTWRFVDTLDLTLHPPSSGLALVAIAHRIHQRKAYDAAYIDLALRLPAVLWTLDGSLARHAKSAGFPVVLLV